MHVFLIRHGQSEGNLVWPDAPPNPDPALTELGRQQARRAADALAGERIAALYSSPLTRALETAAPIAEATGLAARVRPELAETNRMGWNDPDIATRPMVKSGLSPREVRERFPGAEFAAGYDEDARWWEGLIRERQADAYARAAEAWRALSREHPLEEETIAVVTHGAFGSVLMCVALETPPTLYNRYSQYNTGISLVTILPGEVRLRRLNSVEHLPPELRTDLT